jgi:hypothetical protein
MDGRTIGQTQRKNMRLLVKVTEKFKNIYPLGKFVLASNPLRSVIAVYWLVNSSFLFFVN